MQYTKMCKLPQANQLFSPIHRFLPRFRSVISFINNLVRRVMMSLAEILVADCIIKDEKCAVSEVISNLCREG